MPDDSTFPPPGPAADGDGPAADGDGPAPEPGADAAGTRTAEAGRGRAEAPPRPPRRRGVVAAWVAGALAVVVAVVATGAYFVRLPYVLYSPGSATPLDDQVLTIEGASTYEHDGELLFLTVSISNRRPNVYRVLQGWLDPDVAVEGEGDALRGDTREELRLLNQFLMQRSQDVATKVALEEVGYTVTEHDDGALVVRVVEGGPADGRLAVADVIVAVDGHPVTRSEEIAPLVQAHAPGDEVVFTVRRGEETLDVNVPAGERDGVAYAGIATQTLATYDFPIDVQIDTRRVGGPSAGLAFALAIIDDLTPGDLTGGKKVAVTGEIAPDGTVERVGGVEQKTVVARESGASLMLVPADEVEETKGRAGDVKVVGVRTIDDALRALRDAGGAPVEHVAAGVRAEHAA